ncbi:hypothetical protein ACEN2A_08370 [Corynebacterium auriscanis]|uniref:VG15 protein n=1 Tax=Corynebacterium auriscanis TaxID=99807 RepID=UPI003CF867FA
MSLQDFKAQDDRLAEELDRKVQALVREAGVPRDMESMWSLIEDILEILLPVRKSFYDSSIRMVGRQVAAHGMEVSPAPLAPYEPESLWKVLLRALGLEMHEVPTTSDTSYFDEQFIELVDESFDGKSEAEALDLFTRKLSASVVRHARQAGRDAVIDTADRDRVRWADTKKPVKPAELPKVRVNVHEQQDILDAKAEADAAKNPGSPRKNRVKVKMPDPEPSPNKSVLGWARVLVGQENCPFCAMLASRGPVYTEKTVLLAGRRSRTRDGLQYHDHCDCTAVAVVRGKPWEGEEQYDALEQLWLEARDAPTNDELDSGLVEPKQRFAARYRAALKDDPRAFSPHT